MRAARCSDLPPGVEEGGDFLGAGVLHLEEAVAGGGGGGQAAALGEAEGERMAGGIRAGFGDDTIGGEGGPGLVMRTAQRVGPQKNIGRLVEGYHERRPRSAAGGGSEVV